jgi:MerR family transcriptional regulator/heat shock protein HspR
MIRFHWSHDSGKAVYTIQIAAELLGCHPRTLRIYEDFGLVSPRRTPKNYRLYSQNDLTRIKHLCALMDEWDLNLPGLKVMLEMAHRFHIEVEQLIEEMLA